MNLIPLFLGNLVELRIDHDPDGFAEGLLDLPYFLNGDPALVGDRLKPTEALPTI